MDYKCERCGKVFYRKSHFETHGKRKIPCNIEKTTVIVKEIIAVAPKLSLN